MNKAGLIADGSTIALPSMAPLQPAGQTFTPSIKNNNNNDDDRILTNDKPTLNAGMTINGIPTLVIGTSTSTIPLLAHTTPIITAAGQTFTPIGSNAVVVDDGSRGVTLSVGGAAGTIVSMASGGLVVGGSTTVPVSAPASSSSPSSRGMTTSAGLGGVIMSGFGGGGNSSGPEIFERGAAAMGKSLDGVGMRLVVGGVCVVFGGRWAMGFWG